MSDDRNIVYQEGDRFIYRASAVGNSLRTLTAARLGYDPIEPPDYLRRAAEAGHRYEVLVKSEMRQREFRIWGEQNEIEIPVPDTNAVIRGHLDGLNIVHPDHQDLFDPLLEVKSMSKRVWDKWQKHGFDRFDSYRYQLRIYQEGKRILKGLDQVPDAVYAVACRDHDDLNQLDVRVIRGEQMPMDEIFQKIQVVEFFGARDELPTCTGSEYRCPYDYLCDYKSAPTFEELEQSGEERMMQLARDYDQAREDEKSAKNIKEAARDDIVTALAGKEAVAVPGWSLTYKRPKPRRSLNMVALREKLAEVGEELDDYFTEEPSKPRLTVNQSTGENK